MANKKDVQAKVSTTTRNTPQEESRIIDGFHMAVNLNWQLREAARQVTDLILLTTGKLLDDYKDAEVRSEAAQWVIDEIHERTRRNITWTGYAFTIPPDNQDDTEE